MAGWDLSSLSLARRARAMDQDAVALLYERYGPRLRLALRRKLGGVRGQGLLDSEDLMHDGILAALHGIESFEYRGEGSLLAWLLRVAERELLMRLRAQRTLKRDRGREKPLDAARSQIDPAEGPSDTAEKREEIRRLEAALETLPERERDVIVLRRFMDFDNEEIAVELELPSAGAARALLSRAQSRLALALDEDTQ
jgi:RNA polymerase sigma-70 factor (ECF subfamily)